MGLSKSKYVTWLRELLCESAVNKMVAIATVATVLRKILKDVYIKTHLCSLQSSTSCTTTTISIQSALLPVRTTRPTI
jgi:hypothetical protein